MKTPEMLNVLLIMEQCNPEWASVPLVGYNFYQGIRKRVQVTLVTHERNREALEKIRNGHRIDYIDESKHLKKYYGFISGLTSRGGGKLAASACTYLSHLWRIQPPGLPAICATRYEREI